MPTRKHSPQLKLLLGVQPNERIDDTVKPAGRVPRRPTTLNAAERKVWDLVIAELRDMDQLSAADTHEIHAYCQLVALAERIRVEISSAPLTSVNANTGVVHSNPLLLAYQMTLVRAHTIATTLGLNPHGRCVIKGRPMAKPDTEAANVKELYA